MFFRVEVYGVKVARALGQRLTRLVDSVTEFTVLLYKN